MTLRSSVSIGIRTTRCSWPESDSAMSYWIGRMVLRSRRSVRTSNMDLVLPGQSSRPQGQTCGSGCSEGLQEARTGPPSDLTLRTDPSGRCLRLSAPTSAGATSPCGVVGLLRPTPCHPRLEVKPPTASVSRRRSGGSRDHVASANLVRSLSGTLSLQRSRPGSDDHAEQLLLDARVDVLHRVRVLLGGLDHVVPVHG